VAVDADPECDDADVLTEVDAVEHQRDQVQLGQRPGEQIGQCGFGRLDEPPADRGLACRRRRPFDLLADRL
jgi:hypothetical protein